MRYIISFILSSIVFLVSCGGSSSTPNNPISMSIVGSENIKTKIGASREVKLMFSSSEPITNFQFTNLSQIVQDYSSITVLHPIVCNQLSKTKTCTIDLLYQPKSIADSGKITLQYTYNKIKTDQKSQHRSLLSSTTTSGSSSTTLTATTTNNVNANLTPNSPIEELIGLSQVVSINFATDSGTATNLSITSGLSGSAGWTMPSSFSCSSLDSCTLNLTYTPTAISQAGTLSLAYSYTNSSGDIATATVSIPYLALTWGSNYTSSGMQYMSASTVEALNEVVSDIHPAISSSLIPYLDSDSALGYLGPISSFGPLGPLGALSGDSSWSTAIWNSMTGLTSSWTDYFNSISGPLSSSGPLGENGPYTTGNYYNGSVFTSNEFAANTRNFGLWSILGPTGPLGAVGPLGPLGPIGATGYTTNANGSFVDSDNQVVTQVSVPYDPTTSRVFDLYENYTQSYAESSTTNDTSFMVIGNLGASSSNSYTINSGQDQIVSVLVVPNSTTVTNIMFVGVYNSDGSLIALSNSLLYVNYVMFTAMANTAYTVKITQYADNLSSAYRLFVTGSYSYLNEYYINGNYISSY